jgi:hypothetical protein
VAPYYQQQAQQMGYESSDNIEVLDVVVEEEGMGKEGQEVKVRRRVCSPRDRMRHPLSMTDEEFCGKSNAFLLNYTSAICYIRLRNAIAKTTINSTPSSHHVFSMSPLPTQRFLLSKSA